MTLYQVIYRWMELGSPGRDTPGDGQELSGDLQAKHPDTHKQALPRPAWPGLLSGQGPPTEAARPGRAGRGRIQPPRAAYRSSFCVPANTNTDLSPCTQVSNELAPWPPRRIRPQVRREPFWPQKDLLAGPLPEPHLWGPEHPQIREAPPPNFPRNLKLKANPILAWCVYAGAPAHAPAWCQLSVRGPSAPRPAHQGLATVSEKTSMNRGKRRHSPPTGTINVY